jgi:cell division protein FtsN
MRPGESVESTDMANGKMLLGLICAVAIGLAACSGEQSDWEKARAANNTDSYESFVKKYPNGSFAPQAQARLKELYEERDWQKARDADTPDAYQAFLKQYPEGKWAEEARIRVENFNLAQTPAGATAQPGATSPAASAAGPPASGAPPAAAKAPVQKAAPAAKSAAGTYGVQLGAFSSGSAPAERHWDKLVKKNSAALSGLTHRIRTTKTSKGHLYRLQVTGLTRANADSVCKQVKAHGDGCIVLRPAHAKHKAKSGTKKR